MDKYEGSIKKFNYKDEIKKLKDKRKDMLEKEINQIKLLGIR